MVKYPNGHLPRANARSVNQATRKSQTVQYGSRGMSLEERINQSNAYYKEHQLAVIHKKPTPIQVVKVDFPKRSAARITEAYYRHASTTDYNGIYQGRYIDFEAKETTNKTSFPLANLAEHQIEHMRQCHEQGGLVFLLISFKVHQTVYLLPYQRLAEWLAHSAKKSIPLTYLEEVAFPCKLGLFPPIDYLDTVDTWLTTQC